MNLVAQAFRWMGRNRADMLRLTAAAVVVIAILAFTHQWWDEIKAALMRTDTTVFLLLVSVLPMGGVSVALIYVVVGARFGAPWGLLIVGVTTIVHLVGMHLIARSILRRPIERLLHRRNYRLSHLGEEAPVPVALLGALVPGLPYCVRNYLLALSGVPLRIYGPVCWPVYVIRSGVAIFAGEWATELTISRVAFLAGFYAVKVGICAVVVWHLRRHRGAKAQADRRQPARRAA